MIIITRKKDKYFYGGKVVCPIKEEEYNLFKELRDESSPVRDHGFITFGVDYTFDKDVEEGDPTPMTDLVKDLDKRLKDFKKELQDIKKQKLKMK